MKNILKIVILILFFAQLKSDPFPFYNRCDPLWSNVKLSWFKNMCQSGSLFTSISALIRGYNLTLLNLKDSNPQTLIEWLDNKGYSTSFYDWKSIIELGFEYYGFQEKNQIIQSIAQGFVGVLYNYKKDEWALCHKIDQNGFLIHDTLLGASRLELDDVMYGGVYKFINK